MELEIAKVRKEVQIIKSGLDEDFLNKKLSLEKEVTLVNLEFDKQSAMLRQKSLGGETTKVETESRPQMSTSSPVGK